MVLAEAFNDNNFAVLNDLNAFGGEHDDNDNPTGRTLNRLLAVVHGNDNDPSASGLIQGLIIPTETPTPWVVLEAAAIASALKSFPLQHVSAVGVSAVSDEVAAELWGDIVTDSGYLNAGKGYMKHPSYHYDKHTGVCDFREMSYNFGWNRHARHVQAGNLENQLGRVVARHC